MTDPLARLAEAAGVATSYRDQMGQDRPASPETLRAVLAALELPAGTDAEAAETLAAFEARRERRSLPYWQVVEAGPFDPGEDGRIREEDGHRHDEGAAVTLPPGLHWLERGEEASLLLTVPPRPPLPRRRWGVTLPLYGLRTAAMGGIGDYADLARAVGEMGQAGAAFVGVNPIHAGFPYDPSASSPYSPSHRRRLNVLHIATGGMGEPDGDLIDYGEVTRDKMEALERAFAAFRANGGDPAFDAWRAAEGEALEHFAIHQALSERHGSYWSAWPEPFTDPASPEVAAFAEEAADRVTFHAFLQYRATEQLLAVGRAAEAAGMAYGLYLDLAVGTHPHGAETWAEPHAFARGVSLGAPPDAFSAEGQTWGLAPLSPLALEVQGFRPLIETLRAQLRYARLLRIDHILGFDRAFWVPDGLPGTYVQMPREAMLAVARIEAHRANATIIGEDLGNVPEGLHRGLDEAGLLGCRLAMFEQADGRFKPPEAWDERVLASFTTHDLPTYAGWRKGRDIEWRRRVGDIDDETAARVQDERRGEVEAFDRAVGGGNVDAMHGYLARLSSALVALPVEDILELEEQPNLPGTIDEHPNWRRRLPVGPEALADDPRFRRAARIMSEGGR